MGDEQQGQSTDDSGTIVPSDRGSRVVLALFAVIALVVGLLVASSVVFSLGAPAPVQLTPEPHRAEQINDTHHRRQVDVRATRLSGDDTIVGVQVVLLDQNHSEIGTATVGDIVDQRPRTASVVTAEETKYIRLRFCRAAVSTDVAVVGITIGPGSESRGVLAKAYQNTSQSRRSDCGRWSWFELHRDAVENDAPVRDTTSFRTVRRDWAV